MSVFVANESAAPADETALVGLARHVLDATGVSPLAELSVLLVDLDTMTSLNAQYTGEERPTDVLAFPQDEVIAAGVPDDDVDNPEALMGDVVLCPSYAEAGALQAGHPLAAELELLLCHGILHLLGYDHADEGESAEMFGRQRDLLASWARARGASGPAG